MKEIILLIFLSVFINYIYALEPLRNKSHSSLLFDVLIGQNNTRIKMLFNTFTTNHTLYSNSNRKYAITINEKRNHSSITESITINEVPLNNFEFNLKIDPTEFNDQSIQGEFGLGINLAGKNDFINTLYKEKIIFQKELIIGRQTILDTYLVTDKYYFANLTDKNDLPEKYHDSWIVEQSHILTGTSKKELMWNNSEEINARAIFKFNFRYMEFKYD